MLLQSSNIFLARLNTTSTFYALNKSYHPEINEFQDELEWYVDYSMKECLNKSSISSQFNISSGDPKSQVFFTSTSTVFKLNFPVIINYGGKKYFYSEYLSEKQVRFLRIWEAVNAIINMTKEDPEYVNVDLLFELPQNVSITPDASGDSLIYTITDPGSNLNNQKFYYSFAVYIGDKTFQEDEEFLSRNSDSENSVNSSDYEILEDEINE